LVTRRAVLLGQGGQPIEVEQNDPAAHAGPGIDALGAPVEDLALPGLLPEIGRVAPGVGSRPEQVSPAEGALAVEGGHRAAEDTPGKSAVGSRQSAVCSHRLPTAYCRLPTDSQAMQRKTTRK